MNALLEEEEVVLCARLPFLPTSDAAKADLQSRVTDWCTALPPMAAVPHWCGTLIGRLRE